MKIVLFAIVVSAALIAIIVLRPSDLQIRRARYFGSPEPILPMAFAHADHKTVNCVKCHHNYVDHTGHEKCMSCHVKRKKLFLVLEAQFHKFCRGCHAKLSEQGKPGGPPRQCLTCHHLENKP